MFQRFYEEGLAQASFLVGCDRTKQAAVIDPRRDASIYVEAARQAGATIVAAIETHVHADFVAGARELASIGARVLTGPGAGLAFDAQKVRDGEPLALGDVTLTFLHTPGHTFEHIAIDAVVPDQPRRLFTGDLLFVGGVGRPDLVGEAQTRELAGQLFDSLQRVMRMDRRGGGGPRPGPRVAWGAGGARGALAPDRPRGRSESDAAVHRPRRVHRRGDGRRARTAAILRAHEARQRAGARAAQPGDRHAAASRRQAGGRGGARG